MEESMMERDASQAGTDGKRPRPERAGEVRAILEEWAAGVRARNIDAVLRNHAPGMSMFDVVGPIRINGREAYARTWLEQFFAWHGGDGRFDLRDLEVFAGDEIAFASGLIDCAGTEKGERVEFTLRLTVGLKHGADGWSIVHEHHSEPLPFDQGNIGGTGK
jgi:ketosteroid isomerase-like protein